jgi:hypothetical protein
MTDFSHEELESILDAFNYIEDNANWRNRDGWDGPLKAKIEAMLSEKSCAHQWVAIWETDEVSMNFSGHKCLLCSRIMRLTLDE